MNALPAPFVERAHALLGAEAAEFLQALDKAPVAGLRVNTLKTSVEAFRARAPWPLEPVPWCPSGFVVSDDERPGQHPYHAAGLYYLQEPTAMAVAESFAPAPGEWLLDLAAAPGGKSTHLLSLMHDTGLLVANEIEARRTAALIQNLERWGVRNAVVANESPERLADAWRATFDCVLLDAPCSGEGMFRKSEAARQAWSLEHVRGCSLRQARALESAAQLVRPGGWLAYSTCTFAPEENEAVIGRFLDAHREFALAPIHLAGGEPGRPEWAGGESNPALMHAVRFWPHRVRGEGDFIALLRRVSAEAAGSATQHWDAAPRRVQALWRSFAAEHFSHDPALDRLLAMRGDRLYAVPAGLPTLAGLRVLRAGLWLGTQRGERFEPSHSLALALRPEEMGRRTTSLDFEPDDERLHRYLAGHPLDEPGENGWLLITVSGYPLGWGRRAQGIVKNYYPKGLRRTGT